MTTAAGPNGIVYGEGQVLITTKDGESVSWKGMGVGKHKGLEMALSGRVVKLFKRSPSREA